MTNVIPARLKRESREGSNMYKQWEFYLLKLLWIPAKDMRE